MRNRFFHLSFVLMIVLGYFLIGCGNDDGKNLSLLSQLDGGINVQKLGSYFFTELLPPEWLPWTTDGSAAIACRDSALTGGVQCNGRYCDNVKLLCRDSGFTQGNSWWTSWFSEEGSNERICENNGFVTGIKCSGDYCDNISLRCSQLSNGGTRAKCYWTGPLSEENGGTFVTPESMYVAGVRCAGSNCDNKRFYLCQADAGSAPADLDALARTYAPRIRFDQQFGTGSGEQSKCFPSDPAVYYEKRAQGVSAVNLCNKDYSTIANNRVPIYYMAKQCGTNTVIIRYWFFYAWQSTCALDAFGQHAADWESVAVLIVNGQLARVAFYQHGGWYARNAGNFQTVGGTHPVAYAGKNAHGSYHDDGGSGGCLYFEDFRNPGSNDYHMDTWNNLAVLKRGSGMPVWMNCTGDGCFDGVGHPIEQTGELCGQGGCNKDGCSKSDVGGNVPFIVDPSGSDLSLIVAKHSGKALDVLSASTANGASIVQWDAWGGANQRWQFQSTGDGYAQIVSKNSGKCIDVPGSQTGDGVAVTQYSCNSGSNQRFRLVNQGGGYYTIQAKHSGKCLDVYAFSQNNGGKLVQWTCGAGDNQRFRFGR